MKEDPSMGGCPENTTVMPNYEAISKNLTVENERLVKENQALRNEIEIRKAQQDCVKQGLTALFTTAALFEYQGGKK